MRTPYLIISSIFLLLTIIFFSFPSKITHIPIFSKKITLAHYDSDSQDVALSKPMLFEETRRLKSNSVEVNASFSLNPVDLKHPFINLFQTDVYNSGLRYELTALPDGSFTSGIVIANKTLPEGYFSFSLGNPPIKLYPNKKYSLYIKTKVDGRRITYRLSELIGNEQNDLAIESIKNPQNHLVIKNIAIGSGHDPSRQFRGKIDDFEMQYKEYISPFSLWQVNILAFLFLIVGIGISIFGNRMVNPSNSFKKISSYCIASILIFSYPLLQIYSINRMDVSVSVILEYMGMLASIAVLLFLALYFIYRNLEKAFIMTLICAFYLLFLGRIEDYFSFLITDDVFIFLALMVLLVLHIVMQITKRRFAAASHLKKIVYLLFSMSIVSIVFYSVKPAFVSWTILDKEIKTGATLAYKPDVYFIISDMHASQSSILKHLGYNNQGFVEKMRGLGFMIPNNASSNYAYTVLSIPSMLNLSYLPQSFTSTEQIRKYFSENELARYLKKIGYQYIFISPRRYIIEKSDIADANITCSKISDFEGILWSYSLFFRANKLGDTYRQDVLCGFQKIKTAVSMPGPKLVFAHILSPHPPYVFDENGNKIPREEQQDVRVNATKIELNKKGYLGQLKYVETNVLELVKFIQKNSKQPPIIIIQSDHGFSLYSDPDISSGKKLPPAENINARMRVLSAYYFPQGGNAVLYDTISPINMTRGMLRYYFHRDDLEKLPDTNYWSAEMDLFRFSNVTDVVKGYR